MLSAILGVLTPLFSTVAKNLFPDPADELRRIELQNQLQLEMMKQAGALEAAAADIVKAEAQSEHWLVASWRPIIMLTFAGLIVARWLGWSAPGIAEEEILKLWDIVEFGLGGYVVGRSVEKVAGPVASAVATLGKK